MATKTPSKPSTATLSVKLVSDTGTSASDGITSLGALAVTPLSTSDILNYRFSADGGLTWTGWASTKGSIPAPAADGSWLVQVQELTTAGKLKATASLAFKLDTSAVAPVLTLVNDTGVPGDHVSADGHVAVSGVESGARIEYSTNGGASWTSTFTAVEGLNSLLAHQIDVAGNKSAAASLSFTLDTVGPSAADDAASTLQEQAVTIDMLHNDSDATGVTLSSIGSAAHGTLAEEASGWVTYTPDAGFTGTDTFTYIVLDGAGNAATATVTVTVDAPPPPPPPVVDPGLPFTPLDPVATQASTIVDAMLAASSGIVVDTASIAWHASGTQSTNLYDGSLAPLGIGAGLLITSGTTPGTSNTMEWFGTDNSGADFGTPGFDNGDGDLDAVVNTVFSTVSYDATTLSFDFEVTDPTATSVSFDLVFGSDEFPEWVDQFVDCGIVMVNGVNYALFNHDAMHPLSVIGSNLAGNYVNDNGDGHLPIEYDGVSAVLKIVAPITAGTNTLKIAIGDTGDHIYDSGMFIANLKAGNLPATGILIEQPGSSGGEGNDLVDQSGSTSSDTVSGGLGDDVVLGGSAGDTISGGGGSDFLSGGAGADEFDYSDLHDWAADGMDTITDFSGNSVALANASNTDAIDGDVLVFSHSALAGVAGAVMDGFVQPGVDRFSTLALGNLSGLTDGQADQAHAQFVYDASTGVVAFDADGTGTLAAVEVTTIGLAGEHPAGLQLTDIVICG